MSATGLKSVRPRNQFKSMIEMRCAGAQGGKRSWSAAARLISSAINPRRGASRAARRAGRTAAQSSRQRSARSQTFYLRLGFVLIDLDKVEELSAALEQALALYPTSHDAISVSGRVTPGALDAALTHYRRALELKADSAHNRMCQTTGCVTQQDVSHNRMCHRRWSVPQTSDPQVSVRLRRFYARQPASRQFVTTLRQGRGEMAFAICPNSF
jgi:hypothetical protein